MPHYSSTLQGSPTRASSSTFNHFQSGRGRPLDPPERLPPCADAFCCRARWAFAMRATFEGHARTSGSNVQPASSFSKAWALSKSNLACRWAAACAMRCAYVAASSAEPSRSLDSPCTALAVNRGRPVKVRSSSSAARAMALRTAASLRKRERKSLQIRRGYS